MYKRISLNLFNIHRESFHLCHESELFILNQRTTYQISSPRLARIVDFLIAASHSSNRSLIEYDAYCNKLS
jgi:hypothetical protein